MGREPPTVRLGDAARHEQAEANPESIGVRPSHEAEEDQVSITSRYVSTGAGGCAGTPRACRCGGTKIPLEEKIEADKNVVKKEVENLLKTYRAHGAHTA